MGVCSEQEWNFVSWKVDSACRHTTKYRANKWDKIADPSKRWNQYDHATVLCSCNSYSLYLSINELKMIHHQDPIRLLPKTPAR